MGPGKREKVTVRVPSLANGISQQPPHLRLGNQVALANNAVFSVVDGVSKRSGSWMTSYVDNTFAQTGNYRVHPIVRDESERYVVTIGNMAATATIRVFHIDGPVDNRECPVTIAAGSATYIDTSNHAYRDIVRLITIADTTFVLNTTVAPAAVTTTGTITITSATNPTTVTCSAAHGLTTGDTVTISGSNGTPGIDGGHVITVTGATTFTVAINSTGVGSAGTWTNCKITASTMPQVMTRTIAPTEDITITSSTAASPTVVTAAAHGMVVGQTVVITGSTGSSPGTLNGVHVISAVTTNTFTVPVDCSVSGGTGGIARGKAAFAINPATWNQRPTGDDLTNPIPDLITDGTPFTDISFTRERLVLSGEDTIITSQTGDTFNLWVQDATNVVDSDPISINVASDEAVTIEYMVLMRKSVLLFTRNGRQFELSSGGESFAQSNVSVTPTTRIKTVPVRPVAIDPAVYMVSKNDAAAQVHEFVYDEIALPSSAEEITSHARDLIFIKQPDTGEEAIIRSMAACPQNGMIVVGRTDFSGDSAKMQDLFVYCTYYREQTKLQSAWTRISFSGDHGIHDFCVIGNDLFLLRGYTLAGTYTTFIERMPLLPESSHRVTS